MSLTMLQTLKKTGRCHVFGDSIPLDEGVMAFSFAIDRITDPVVLIPHLFEGIDPSFASRVKPGDFVVAGRDFCCGKPHFQGFIAMAALSLGVLCSSMPRTSLRGAISNGLPVLTGWSPGVLPISDGDEIEVDLETGMIHNITEKTSASVDPMPFILQDIIRHGGVGGQLKVWLDQHPELKLQSGAAPVLQHDIRIKWMQGSLM
jgi:3-isopropylmalate/(R)-2-methylmalate dehydratase small subunit